jgi:hypothetical protein
VFAIIFVFSGLLNWFVEDKNFNTQQQLEEKYLNKSVYLVTDKGVKVVGYISKVSMDSIWITKELDSESFSRFSLEIRELNKWNIYGFFSTSLDKATEAQKNIQQSLNEREKEREAKNQ